VVASFVINGAEISSCTVLPEAVLDYLCYKSIFNEKNHEVNWPWRLRYVFKLVTVKVVEKLCKTYKLRVWKGYFWCLSLMFSAYCRYRSVIFITPALVEGVWLDSRSGGFNPKQILSVPTNRNFVGPRARSVLGREEKTLFRDWAPVVQAVSSQCTDRAVLSPNTSPQLNLL